VIARSLNTKVFERHAEIDFNVQDLDLLNPGAPSEERQLTSSNAISFETRHITALSE
jgi:hypothetical protein